MTTLQLVSFEDGIYYFKSLGIAYTLEKSALNYYKESRDFPIGTTWGLSTQYFPIKQYSKIGDDNLIVKLLNNNKEELNAEIKGYDSQCTPGRVGYIIRELDQRKSWGVSTTTSISSLPTARITVELLNSGYNSADAGGSKKRVFKNKSKRNRKSKRRKSKRRKSTRRR
jgi:hypothetical protein